MFYRSVACSPSLFHVLVLSVLLPLPPGSTTGSASCACTARCRLGIGASWRSKASRTWRGATTSCLGAAHHPIYRQRWAACGGATPSRCRSPCRASGASKPFPPSAPPTTGFSARPGGSCGSAVWWTFTLSSRWRSRECRCSCWDWRSGTTQTRRWGSPGRGVGEARPPYESGRVSRGLTTGGAPLSLALAFHLHLTHVLAPLAGRSHPPPAPQSELQAALEQSRPCVEWSQHIAAAHDPARARGQPWWAAITPEQQSEEGERPSAGE
jgi:hypothetical protein